MEQYQELEKLAELKEKEIITEEEFLTRKKYILENPSDFKKYEEHSTFFLLDKYCVVSILLLICFFLPWIHIGGLISLTGYQFPEILKGLSILSEAVAPGETLSLRERAEHVLVYSVYLIPLFSIAIISANTKKFDVAGLAFVAGGLILIPLIERLVFVGVEFVTILSVGGWGTVACAIALFIMAMFDIFFTPQKKGLIQPGIVLYSTILIPVILLTIIPLLTIKFSAEDSTDISSSLKTAPPNSSLEKVTLVNKLLKKESAQTRTLMNEKSRVIQSGSPIDEPAPVTHCSQHERIYFSCGLDRGKVVSLCASRTGADSGAYLQYRIGIPGEKLNMVYPEDLGPPARFFLGSSQAFSGGGASHLRFEIEEYSYIVFSGTGRGWDKKGVVVKRRGEQIAYLPCENKPVVSELGLSSFEFLKIPEDLTPFDIPQ